MKNHPKYTTLVIADQKRRRRGWLRKCLLGAALGLKATGMPLFADDLPQYESGQADPLTLPQADGVPALSHGDGVPASFASAQTTYSSDTYSHPMNGCLPCWCDPVSCVPNMFGDFFAVGNQACSGVPQPLMFTGGGEGFVTGPTTARVADDFLPVTINGPGGPYNLTTDITGTGTPPNYVADENAEFTALVQGNFPGATFVNGAFVLPADMAMADILFNYQFGQTFYANLANPTGGGLVGRNRYFDNGSPIPRDRVYFTYNRIGNYRGLIQRFDLNRFVFGGEKTFADNMASFEVRVPFAGTADSDQFGGQNLAVNNTEFGNVGLLVKGVLYRTPNFLASVGLGMSIPTADDTRMLVNGQPVIEIENRTWLLQPLFGVVWAPNDRFYTQGGVQFDLAANGNPVLVTGGNGNMLHAGKLTDQGYVYATGSAGYWLYQNCEPQKRLNGISLQGELHYTGSLGSADTVQSGNLVVTDLASNYDSLNGSAGFNFVFREDTLLAVGCSAPLAGDRLYDWNFFVQLNHYFGQGQQ